MSAPRWKKGSQLFGSCRHSFKSSVVIIPPGSEWRQIQNIRAVHDPAYVRWMPHINIGYPFLEDKDGDIAEAADKIKQKIKEENILPFRVSFCKKSFGHFCHKTQNSVWVKPLNPRAHNKRTTKKIQKKVKNSMYDTKKAMVVAPVPTPALATTTLPSPTPSPGPVGLGAPSPGPVRLGAPSPGPVGLGALAGAVWDPRDNPSLRDSRPTVGIDGLRFAVWGVEDGSAVMTPTTYYTSDKKPQSDVFHNNDVVNSSDDDGESDDDVISYDDVMTDDDVRADNDDVTPPVGVMRIREMLEELFPGLRRQWTLGQPVFHPHLTLGKVPAAETPGFITRVQEGWEDIDFTVTEICIITRGVDTPFSVQYRIPLGRD